MTDPKPLDEQMEMLTQPLTTEEGFLNEACLRELKAKIKSIPPSYERLASNPEWSTPQWTFDHEIVAGLSYAAISAYQNVPPRLEDVLGYLRACLRREVFGEDTIIHEFRMKKLSLCDINRILHDILRGLMPFMLWNDRETMGDNWLDLDACLHQVCILLRNRRRHDKAFDDKFEREYGPASKEES